MGENRILWFAGIAASAVVVVLLIFPEQTPSHWLKLKQDDVSEWLAWIGLLAFALSLDQLVRTKSAAVAATEAAQRATQSLHRASLSSVVDAAASLCGTAAAFVSTNDFHRARIACEDIFVNFVQIKLHRAHIAEEQRKALDQVHAQILSAQSFCTSGMKGELDQQGTLDLQDAFNDQKRELMLIAGYMRTEMESEK